jgi:hypothetical protein
VSTPPKLQPILLMLLAVFLHFYAPKQEDAPAAQPAAAAPGAPKLKDDVALELRNAEWEMAKLGLQIQADQKAIDDARAADAAAQAAQKELATLMPQSQKAQAKYMAVFGEALKRSGIDPDKFTLDADTLAVSKKGAPPAPPAPPAPVTVAPAAKSAPKKP